MGHIVYFSNISGNTARFIQALECQSTRIPIYAHETVPVVEQPFVLVTPTYGGCPEVTGSRGASVPKQVVRFLNNPLNRGNLRGVISSGNINFGESFAIAGDIIAAKCEVPLLYRFELMGTAQDVVDVRDGLEKFWLQQR